MLKTIYHFFRLIRTANLLVIGLTMTVVHIFIYRYSQVFIQVKLHDKEGINLFLDQLDNFILLIISTLLIAAAGNIINDYFDVKADRVNKPNRLIIGKYIKRRWAMVLHWSFNSLGMVLALYVGYVLQNIWVPLIAFSTINLLWFYSAYYKRRPFIGNLIVAVLIGIIPIYVMLFNWPIIGFSFYRIRIVLFISLIAFFINLIRELVKDIQDVRGDLRLGANTFPIKYGIKKTKYLIILISIMFVLLSFMFGFFLLEFYFDPNIRAIHLQLDTVYWLLIGSIFFFLTSLIFIFFFNKNKTYKIASTLLKIAMLFGLLTPLFL